MGELIRKVGEIHLAGTRFDIEVNEATRKGGDNIIHVQSEKVRYEFEETDFIKLSTLILSARDCLHYYKNGGGIGD